MGYTTKFSGQFSLDKPLKLEHAALLNAMSEADLTNEDWKEYYPHPDHYFQWEPTKDRKGIVWNGGEKFYDYVEWLQWLIDRMLTPWGYTLSGRVEFQGEDRDDYGFIEIKNGKAVKVDSPVKAWSECGPVLKKQIIKIIEECVADSDMTPLKWQTFKAAMNLLKGTP